MIFRPNNLYRNDPIEIQRAIEAREDTVDVDVLHILQLDWSLEIYKLNPKVYVTSPDAGPSEEATQIPQVREDDIQHQTSKDINSDDDFRIPTPDRTLTPYMSRQSTPQLQSNDPIEALNQTRSSST